jgi:uncharacterized protein (TIGR03382 family)
MGNGWKRAAAAGVMALSVLGGARDASAYATKETQAGARVRWEQGAVAFAIDPALAEAHEDAAAMVGRAAGAWSQAAAGAPAVSASGGSADMKASADGRNVVVYAAKDFAPIGKALAVTVLSYEESTGRIIDADIVVSSKHAFGKGHFDLEHVLAHEVGHALGLGDESREDVLMFASTKEGKEARRSLAADDVDGLRALYAPQAEEASSAAAGCNAAGSSPSGALLVLAALVLVVRRRRAFVTLALALAAASFAPADARASDGVMLRIESARTVNEDGIFRTELITRAGTIHVWGGTLDGITQRVGDLHVPRVGQEVQVRLTGVANAPYALATETHHGR